MIKPLRPPYISVSNWDRMSWKEKDYVHLLRQNKYTKQELKRSLYITSDQGLRKLSRRVAKLIRAN